jgi:NDP-sugar pyrophosphorylase family protein
MSYLQSQTVTNAILCAGYGAEDIMRYCSDGSRWGIRLRYSVETAPLGTAGALKHAEGLIDSDPFLAFNGDSLIRADLSALLRFHADKNAGITLVLARVADRSRFGSATLAEDGSITRFCEKGEHGPGLINAGIYAVSHSVLEEIPIHRKTSLEADLLQGLARRRICGMPVSGPFVDIGTPEAYQEAQDVMAGVRSYDMTVPASAGEGETIASE